MSANAGTKSIGTQNTTDEVTGTLVTCKEITWQDNTLGGKQSVACKSLMCSNGTEIRYNDPEQTERLIIEQRLVREGADLEVSAIQQALDRHSDLIPGVYEGGLKVWECSIDLVDYLAKTNIKGLLKSEPLHVLELGCGAGLPGIYMLLQGANVHFQDYNSEVLHHLTMPSVALNLPEVTKQHIDVSKPKVGINKRQVVQFFSGDWQDVCKMLKDKQHQYDLILTAETIYNIESYPKLHDIFDSLLHDKGEIYVAAKSYYFGVGGGTQQFTDYLDKRGQFCAIQCFVNDTGVKREILCLKRRKAPNSPA